MLGDKSSSSHHVSLRINDDLYRKIMEYSRSKRITKSKGIKELLEVSLKNPRKVARFKKLEQKVSKHLFTISIFSNQLSSIGNLLNQGIRDANYQVLKSNNIQAKNLIVLVNRVTGVLSEIKRFIGKND